MLWNKDIGLRYILWQIYKIVCCVENYFLFLTNLSFIELFSDLLPVSVGTGWGCYDDCQWAHDGAAVMSVGEHRMGLLWWVSVSTGWGCYDECQWAQDGAAMMSVSGHRMGLLWWVSVNTGWGCYDECQWATYCHTDITLPGSHYRHVYLAQWGPDTLICMCG